MQPHVSRRHAKAVPACRCPWQVGCTVSWRRLLSAVAAKQQDLLCEEGAEGVDVALAALGPAGVQLWLATVGRDSLALAGPVWTSRPVQLAPAPYVDAACCCRLGLVRHGARDLVTAHRSQCQVGTAGADGVAVCHPRNCCPEAPACSAAAAHRGACCPKQLSCPLHVNIPASWLACPGSAGGPQLPAHHSSRVPG
jgi:hypothetical protein